MFFWRSIQTNNIQQLRINDHWKRTGTKAVYNCEQWMRQITVRYNGTNCNYWTWLGTANVFLGIERCPPSSSDFVCIHIWTWHFHKVVGFITFACVLSFPWTHDPSDQHQESWHLAGFDFLSLHRVLIFNCRPIRFEWKNPESGRNGKKSELWTRRSHDPWHWPKRIVTSGDNNGVLLVWC